MGRKKREESSINLDSFLDIMTCLVGVLILIIILTALDASQVRVVIPTPMEQGELELTPIFIEVRNNQLYKLPINEIREQADEALKQIAKEAQGDSEKMLRLIGETGVTNENYKVDLTYALLGQIALEWREGSAEGYRIEDVAAEGPNSWFGRIIYGLNKEEEMLSFIVRDDSFRMFKLARHMAWIEKIQTSYELLPSNEVIKFGLLGTKSMAQ